MAISGQVIFYTKGFLLDLKRRLNVLKEGYDILSKKRDELMTKLRIYVEQLKKLRTEVINDINKALLMFLHLYSAFSKEELESEINSVKSSLVINILPISVMGVIVPKIKILKMPERGRITNIKLVRISEIMLQNLSKLLKLIELESLIEAFIFDLQNTNRIVNALEKIVIPETEGIIKKISEMIEEEMLEEFSRIRMIRDIILRRRGEFL